MARSPVVRAMVSCVAETTVVVRAVPLKLTDDEAIKFVPFTVSVVPGSPAVAELGERLLIVGSGLLGVVLQVTAAELELRGVGGEIVVKSAKLLLVSLQPVVAVPVLASRIYEKALPVLVVVNLVPSAQSAVLPKPTKSIIAAFGAHAAPSGVILFTSATFPVEALILIVPTTSPAGASTGVAVPVVACCTR